MTAKPTVAAPDHAFVYLASQSPRRRALLAQLGLRVEPLPPAPEEDAESLEAFRGGESPTDYVQRVAQAKLDAARARRAARGLPPGPILAADTIVAIGGALLAKPADADDARAMLARLSGITHRVLTAVRVAHGARTLRAITVSRVRFARLSTAAIDAYVASGEPMDKAGAYAIQGGAAAFVRSIQGSYSGIVGLPLAETVALLRRAGLPLP
jgi:septum formation protein